MAYGVWCVVSGGVTGHNEAWLKKTGDSRRWAQFDTKEDAEREAAELNRKMNDRPGSSYYPRATFRYSAREF